MIDGGPAFTATFPPKIDILYSTSPSISEPPEDKKVKKYSPEFQNIDRQNYTEQIFLNKFCPKKSA